MKVLVIAGTRPEAIKVAPIVRELQVRKGIEVVLCNSGQHREMIQQVWEDFHLHADMELNVMTSGQTLASLSARLFEQIESALDECRPDWMLVQGDTTTVMVSALCAFYRSLRVGHIEAGLRSFNKRAPFPEEINREIVSKVADLHFAPTAIARDNLLREGITPDRIVVTGNTVIDALLWMRRQIQEEDNLLEADVRRALNAGKRIVLVTGHRRENFGEGFVAICRALRRLADVHSDVLFVYPVHLNPHVQQPVKDILGGYPGVLLLKPLSYRSFIAHLNVSSLVLTDSGGIQEEAPALGKPVLVMRDVTERPEGVKAGVALLVGAHEDAIVAQTSRLLRDRSVWERMARAQNPYGDGYAAGRIVDAVLAELG